MDTTLPATAEQLDAPTIIEKAVVTGDLSKLQPMERLRYYHAVCQSVGLNPLTKPFQYIHLNGQLQLYATKGATDQVRTLRGISITSAERDTSDPLYATWLVTGTDRAGRTDMDIGSVSIAKLQGDAKANAIMKALTKAKRRLTLSLAGLGNMLDESEVEAAGAEPVDVDDYGEMSPAQRMLMARAEASQQPAQPEPATEATPAASEAPGAATGLQRADGSPAQDGDVVVPGEHGPVAAPMPANEPPATAKEVCGHDGGQLGTCTRMPGHRGKHQGPGGEWPQDRKR